MSINSDFPLKNRVIVLTRSWDQSSESSGIFENLGAKVIQLPTIKIVPPANWNDFDEALNNFSSFDYLIFTSVNAVKMFISRCEEIGVNPDFKNVKVIAIGKKTADYCFQHELAVHLTPHEFRSAGLIGELSGLNLSGKNIFIPKSSIGREELKTELEKLGAIVKTPDAYDVSIPERAQLEKPLKELSSQKPDVFIFTSPSTFENFLKIMRLSNTQEYFRTSIIAAIGPTTKAAIENFNIHVDIMPEEYTMEALAHQLVNHFIEI